MHNAADGAGRGDIINCREGGIDDIILMAWWMGWNFSGLLRMAHHGHPRTLAPTTTHSSSGVPDDKSVVHFIQHNCAADCRDVVTRANDVCYGTPLAQCGNTNPYGSSASCGYGKIKSKRDKKCHKCRCQILTVDGGFQVCGVGKYDDHCTPSQN